MRAEVFALRIAAGRLAGVLACGVPARNRTESTKPLKDPGKRKQRRVLTVSPAFW